MVKKEKSVELSPAQTATVEQQAPPPPPMQPEAEMITDGQKSENPLYEKV